jgi:CAAX prenyl protease-like protein
LTSDQRSTAAYIAPFIAYVGLMAAARPLGIPPQIDFPLRLVVSGLLILLVSRPHLSLRPSRPLASILIGIAVFVIWVGPDVLFNYRHHWLFENSVFGKAEASVGPDLRQNVPFLALRWAISCLLVPILEELFWRGWLMRWLIKPNFLEIPFGTYVASSFWIVAVLFASEHGPYWEVGLAAGVVYNWWAIRTKCLADCILAHAVTNAILSAYVLWTGEWQYWL